MLHQRIDRPLLFLDVDGVLNCPGREQERHEYVILDGSHCYVPRGTKKRVQQICAVYEPIWCTAWLGRAHTAWRDYLGLVGVSWPYVNYREYKLIDLIKMAGERRWAYVDDDAYGYELRGLGWTEDMLAGLVIAPDPYVGLTDDHVAQLLDYARSVPC